MKETFEKRAAFEKYYAMGDKRSLNALAKVLGKSLRTVALWSSTFNWQERIEQRDIENAKKLKEKTDEIVLNSKADYRKDLKIINNVLRYALNDLVKKLKNNAALLEITCIDDLRKLIECYDKATKLDLLLLGEATERTENEPLIVFTDNGKYENDKAE